MRPRSVILFLTAVAGIAQLLVSGCTPDLAGATTETTNGVVGSVRYGDDTPAENTIVKLFPDDYDPVADSGAVVKIFTDTTDAGGVFSFSYVASGNYVVLARLADTSVSCLVGSVPVTDDTITTIPPATLRKTGTIETVFSEGTTPGGSGYVYIPGTDLFSIVNSSGLALLRYVPAGLIPVVIRTAVNGENKSVFRNSVTVRPEDTVIITNPQWKFNRKVVFNTTQSGAGVTGNVYDFPVLIRLNGSNFDFSQARSDGGDLMITGKGNALLPFEIERWDAAARQAEIWVRIDTLFGNDSDQSVIMYWGNPDAADSPNSAVVFDTAAGFQGVWHLGETGNDTARDATVNGYDGIAYYMAETSPVSGAAGRGRTFDGDSSYIRMPNTAGGKLNFPENGYFSVSAWAYVDTFDQVFRTIATKGYEQYFLQMSYFPGPDALWQFSTFKESATWNMSHTTASEKKWVFLTGVKQGNVQSLYCNGELIVKTTATDAVYTHPDVTILRNTSNDFSIGRFLQEATYPTRFGFCFFKGAIDEVRACSVARSSDWIKLSYMNQRSDDKLVQFK